MYAENHFRPADAAAPRGRGLFGLLLLLALVPVLLSTLLDPSPGPTRSLLDTLEAQGAVTVNADGSRSLVLDNDDKWGRLRVSLDRPTRFDDKIRLVYRDADNVSSIHLELPGCEGCPVRHEHESRVVDNHGGAYYFGLNDTDHAGIPVNLRAVSSSAPLEITVVAVDLLSRGPLDSPAFFIALMLSTAASLVLIGTLLTAPLIRLGGDGFRGHLPLLLAPAVFLALTAVVLVLLGLQAAGVAYAAPTRAFAAALLALLMLLAWRGRTGLAAMLGESSGLILTYLGLVAAAAVLLAFIDGIPLTEHIWSTVGKLRMFDGHTAHDNAFQYLNGIAVADHKPFAHYYEAPQMWRRGGYGVEDRQVLSGLMFGAWRVLWTGLSDYVGSAYALFTIFGTALTMLLVIPLQALFARLFSPRIALFAVLVLAMNPYVLGNFYYTWFKILGGGLILVAVVYLHFFGNRRSSWIIAGVLLGMAANLHAGLTMGYPVIALWYIARRVRIMGVGSVVGTLALAAAMTAITVALMAPWEAVKSRHFDDDKSLLRMHMLEGQRFEGELGATVRAFLRDHPLEEQLQKRLGNFVEATRLEEVGSVVGTWRKQGTEAALLRWNRYQYRYFAVMFYPLLALIVIAGIAAVALRGRGGADPGFDWPNANRLLVLGALSIAWGLIIMMTSKEADSSSFVTPFGILVVYTYLLCRLATLGRIGAALFAAWGLFSFYKLYIYFDDVLYPLPLFG